MKQAVFVAGLYFGLMFLFGLRVGSMYPFGPGWFPIRRKEYPFAFWVLAVVFLLVSVMFFASWAGVLPGYTVAEIRIPDQEGHV